MPQRPSVARWREQSKSISKFPRGYRTELDYDKYLQGRSYQLFVTGMNAKQTLIFYRKKMYYFCEFVKMTTEELASKYCSHIKLRGKPILNLEGQLDLQKKIEDYVLMLQDRVSKGEITANTCNSYLPPVKRFFDMNDIVTVNWSRIGRLLPRAHFNSDDEAYTQDQIKKMLQHCDARSRVVVLFLASSGIRSGALPMLRHRDITPIHDENNSAKLVAAHVVIYRGTEEEYDTFITPEAYGAYIEYCKARKSFGEEITKDNYAIINRFNTRGKAIRDAGTKKPISISTITMMLRIITHKAGVREPAANHRNRYNIKQVHGFRKFFNTTLATMKSKDGRTAIDFIHKEWLMGHALTNVHALEENYNRADRVKLLLQDYLKAVPELTITDENRLNVQVKKLQADISNMKEVQTLLDEKDEVIKNMREEFDRKLEIAISRIDQNKLVRL